MCNTCCFSTATIVTRTRLYVTFMRTLLVLLKRNSVPSRGENTGAPWLVTCYVCCWTFWRTLFNTTPCLGIGWVRTCRKWAIIAQKCYLPALNECDVLISSEEQVHTLVRITFKRNKNLQTERKNQGKKRDRSDAVRRERTGTRRR
jgi:hypothetical protein